MQESAKKVTVRYWNNQLISIASSIVVYWVSQFVACFDINSLQVFSLFSKAPREEKNRFLWIHFWKTTEKLVKGKRINCFIWTIQTLRILVEEQCWFESLNMDSGILGEHCFQSQRVCSPNIHECPLQNDVCSRWMKTRLQMLPGKQANSISQRFLSDSSFGLVFLVKSINTPVNHKQVNKILLDFIQIRSNQATFALVLTAKIWDDFLLLFWKSFFFSTEIKALAKSIFDFLNNPLLFKKLTG